MSHPRRSASTTSTTSTASIASTASIVSTASIASTTSLPSITAAPPTAAAATLVSRPGERGAVKIGCLIGGALIAILVILAVWATSNYNSLVTTQEKVTAGWREVHNQYQRRSELVPNLVETVKGAAGFERETLEAVTKARSRVQEVQLPAELPQDPEKLRAYLQAQQGLGAALGRLFAVSEAYPQLKATQNFLSLQDQIEGTENRIAVARRDFIDATRIYNTQRRSFPTNLTAGFFGFKEAATLPVDEAEVRKPPKVDFGK
jgi:LemA protein